MDRQTLHDILARGFGDGEVVVLGDDGEHFEAHVTSPRFAGKSLVEQHQMVYAVLGDLMKQAVHALALKTYTPDAWKKRKA